MMTLVDQGGVCEWALEDGRLVDPTKPQTLGLCIILGCYQAVQGPEASFCKDCPEVSP